MLKNIGFKWNRYSYSASTSATYSAWVDTCSEKDKFTLPGVKKADYVIFLISYKRISYCCQVEVLRDCSCWDFCAESYSLGQQIWTFILQLSGGGGASIFRFFLMLFLKFNLWREKGTYSCNVRGLIKQITD